MLVFPCFQAINPGPNTQISDVKDQPDIMLPDHKNQDFPAPRQRKIQDKNTLLCRTPSLAAQVRDRVWIELLAELLAEPDRPPNVCRPSNTLVSAERWQTCATAGKPGAAGTKPGQPPNVCQPLDTFANASDWLTCLNPGKTTPGSP